MRFLRLKKDGREILHIMEDREIISVPELIGKQVDIENVFYHIDSIKSELKKGKFSKYDLKDKAYLPAVGRPGKIICIGLNYQAHIQETKKEMPKYPVIFSKFNNSLAAHLEKIRIIDDGLKIDYEGELGVMIGIRGFRVREEDALKYVFGYFIGNDISSRELQYRTSQYLLGKTLDQFYPNGPLLVTADEIPNPQDLDIRTYVNGELRQDSNTRNMIFPIRKLISYISDYIPLEPGDIISTGTPDGVISGMPEDRRKWLSRGDDVRIVIEGIGELENNFI